MASERVQKIIAHAGIASRRKAEEFIRHGLVTINGKVAKLGDQANWPQDSIKVNGKLLTKKEPHVYLAFHKPRNVLASMEPTREEENRPDGRNRRTLKYFLWKIKEKIYPVGRMDYAGEGLILLTNDGDFAARIQKSDEIIRTYTVKIKGHPTTKDVEKLIRGGRVDGRLVKPHSVNISKVLTKKSKLELSFVGMGALNVREYLESRNYLVERVIRTSIGHLQLGGLPAGGYRSLVKSQVEALIHQPELGALILRNRQEKKKNADPYRLGKRGKVEE